MDAAERIAASPLLFDYCIYFTRFLLPILAIWILFRCIRSILRERSEPEVWAYLDAMDNSGASSAIGHWECIVGRSRACDVVVDSPAVSRTHAALIRGENGLWSIYDLRSKGGVYVNRGLVGDNGAALENGDVITLADTKLMFRALDDAQLSALSSRRTAPGRLVHPGATFLIVTLFQILLMLQHIITADAAFTRSITMGFAALIVAMWCYYLIMRSIRRTGFEIETLAFFLCSLGVSVTATAAPEEMVKQLVLMLVGILAFFLLGWWLRSLARTKAMRLPAAAISLGLLFITLIAGQELDGAKNWLSFGGFSVQPSEFVKIAYEGLHGGQGLVGGNGQLQAQLLQSMQQLQHPVIKADDLQPLGAYLKVFADGHGGNGIFYILAGVHIFPENLFVAVVAVKGHRLGVAVNHLHTTGAERLTHGIGCHT